MLDARKVGRVTIPTDLDVVPQTLEILKKWGADAIRDCDGTDFPAELQNQPGFEMGPGMSPLNLRVLYGLSLLSWLL